MRIEGNINLVLNSVKNRHQNNPTVKCEMVNDNSALCHHLFQMVQAQGVSQIPAHTLSDNIDGIVQVFEGVSDQRCEQIIF